MCCKKIIEKVLFSIDCLSRFLSTKSRKSGKIFSHKEEIFRIEERNIRNISHKEEIFRDYP